ncbi:MAG: hypothetical protein ACI915_001166 [Gammaproteobacteria bacterium]|jgi:hypothetical protein
MYTKTLSYYLVCLTIAVACATLSPVSRANTVVVSFDFDDSDGAFENAPETLGVGLDSLPWAVQRGTLADFAGSPSSGRALGARSFVDGNRLILELIVGDGFRLAIDGYSFGHLASASGPSEWQFLINDSVYSSGGLSGNFVAVNGELALNDLTGSVFIALAGAAAASNGGTYRLDNFVLTGTVSSVPLAPSVLLFGSGLSLLGFRLRG